MLLPGARPDVRVTALGTPRCLKICGSNVRHVLVAGFNSCVHSDMKLKDLMPFADWTPGIVNRATPTCAAAMARVARAEPKRMYGRLWCLLDLERS